VKNKKDMYIILAIVLGAGGFLYYRYQKDKASANQTSSIVQGSGVLSVLPNTSTTSTPVADTTSWNPNRKWKTQSNAASQAMGMQ
jgi:hypothetical protein